MKDNFWKIHGKHERIKYFSLTFWTFTIIIYRSVLRTEIKKSLKLPQLYSPLPTLVQFKKHIFYKSQSMFIFNMGFYYLQTALRVLTQKERNYWMESQGLPVLALFWDPRSHRGRPLGVRTCVWFDQTHSQARANPVSRNLVDTYYMYSFVIKRRRLE